MRQFCSSTGVPNVNQSINQSMNQSINQSVKKYPAARIFPVGNYSDKEEIM
jgi:hypothetical protein